LTTITGLLALVQTFRVLGADALRMLAIGAELRSFAPSARKLFDAGEAARCRLCRAARLVPLRRGRPGDDRRPPPR